jgi:predicted DNA-binding transcriptional regulator YafY
MFGSGWETMKDTVLKRAAKSGRPVEIIYMDEKGKITQRRIRIRVIREDLVEAYCFERKGVRRFKRSNILAARESE